MKTGRPTKAPDHEKKAIIDRFYIERAGCDPMKMQAHNIYAQLEHFAKDIRFRTTSGQDLTANDFRTTSIKAYIAALAEAPVSLSPDRCSPVFQPLDVDALLGKPLNVFKQTILDREQYLESIYLKAAAALEQYSSMQEAVTRLRQELKQQSAERERLQNACNQLATENREHRKTIEYLRRFIKQQVEPEMARAHFAETTTRTIPTEKLEAMAHTPISKLSNSDRCARNEANNIVDLDFETLCDYTNKESDLH